MEYHKLVLPQQYHRKVLTALHDHMGHQGIDRMLDLLRERVYWPSMAKDAQNWVTNCRRCQIARGNYNQPKPKIGHLEAHNPLDLVCLDFTKIDPSKTGKENVLVITGAFTKFSLAVCTPNQTAKNSSQNSRRKMVSRIRSSYSNSIAIKADALIPTSLRHSVKCMV